MKIRYDDSLSSLSFFCFMPINFVRLKTRLINAVSANSKTFFKVSCYERTQNFYTFEGECNI